MALMGTPEAGLVPSKTDRATEELAEYLFRQWGRDNMRMELLPVHIAHLPLPYAGEAGHVHSFHQGMVLTARCQ
jgi:hypothetical protein